MNLLCNDAKIISSNMIINFNFCFMQNSYFAHTFFPRYENIPYFIDQKYNKRLLPQENGK